VDSISESVPERIPVLSPVAPPAPPPPRRRPGVAVAGALAVVVAAAAALAALGREGEAPPTPEGRFGRGTAPRLAALRDRLAAGLLSLREEGGGWKPRVGDVAFEPVHEAQATAYGLAGLAAARRLGARAAGIAPAIEAARARLRARQRPDGGFGAGAREGRVAGLHATAMAVLAWTLASDPADAGALRAAAERLASETGAGTLPDGFPRGVVTMAVHALASHGYGAAFEADPLSTVRGRDLGPVRDARDPRVAEALLRTLRAAGKEPGKEVLDVARKVHEDGVEWGEDRSDLSSWLLRAWLVSRTPGGERWFAAVLPSLEKAPSPEGVVLGDFYGEPVSRTSSALLILLEGAELRSPFDPPAGGGNR
jgi:hypothetical protein